MGMCLYKWSFLVKHLASRNSPLTHLWVISGSRHGCLGVGLELGNHLC